MKSKVKSTVDRPFDLAKISKTVFRTNHAIYVRRIIAGEVLEITYYGRTLGWVLPLPLRSIVLPFIKVPDLPEISSNDFVWQRIPTMAVTICRNTSPYAIWVPVRDLKPAVQLDDFRIAIALGRAIRNQ